MPVPNQSWVDWSVLDEVALRLRASGGWDNSVADGIAQLKDRVAHLERWTKFTRHAEDKVKRPLRSWADCRKVLLSITQYRTSTFSDIAAPVEVCLKLAVQLAEWERTEATVPTDIRCLIHGAVVVEWSDPYRTLIVG